jgi:hypothetical protein
LHGCVRGGCYVFKVRSFAEFAQQPIDKRFGQGVLHRDQCSDQLDRGSFEARYIAHQGAQKRSAHVCFFDACVIAKLRNFAHKRS